MSVPSEPTDGLEPVRQAFLTGSQVYGLPREDSDVDLVVYGAPGLGARLAELLGFTLSPEELAKASAAGAGRTSLLIQNGIGRALNLIVVEDATDFDAWREGTQQLAIRGFVSRDEAVALFNSLGVNSDRSKS